MPLKSGSAALLAIVFFFCAVVLVQASAFFTLFVPPRNWRQFSFYRRAYARTVPWRLRVGLVMVGACTALAALCVLAAKVVSEDALMPSGPATVKVTSTVTTLLLLLGILSIVISALTHFAAFRARRLTLRLLAQEEDELAGPSGG